MTQENNVGRAAALAAMLAAGFLPALAGAESDVFIRQTGQYLRFSYQSTGAGNTADVEQSGAFHNQTAPVYSRRTPVVGSLRNLPSVTQTGTGNSIRLIQQGTANSAVQYQEGTANRAYLLQTGRDNRAVQAQSGEDNVMELTQTGRSTAAVLVQDRAANAEAYVTQNRNGASLTVTQTGNSPPPVRVTQ